MSGHGGRLLTYLVVGVVAAVTAATIGHLVAALLARVALALSQL